MTADRKRKGKKNKLEEIQKPRGYERGLTMDRIVGATDCTGALQFLVSWYDCDEYDLLAANEVNDKSPDIVISYYEQRCMLNQKCEKRRKIQEQYELDLIEYPPTDLPAIVEEENKTSGQTEASIEDSSNVDGGTNDMGGESTGLSNEEGVVTAAEGTDQTTTNEVDHGVADSDYPETGHSSMQEEHGGIQNVGQPMSDDVSAEDMHNPSHETSEAGMHHTGDVIPDDIQMPSADNY